MKNCLLSLLCLMLSFSHELFAQKTKIVYVDATTAPCQGIAAMQCMLVRYSPKENWHLYYDEIKGFKFIEGYQYQLKIKETKQNDLLADSPSVKWTLIKIMKKIKVVPQNTRPPINEAIPNNIIVADKKAVLDNGLWVLNALVAKPSYTKDDIGSAKIYLSFDEKAKQVIGNAGCNQIAGELNIQNTKMEIENIIATRMACENMILENTFLEKLGKITRFELVENILKLYNDNELLLTFEHQQK